MYMNKNELNILYKHNVTRGVKFNKRVKQNVPGIFTASMMRCHMFWKRFLQFIDVTERADINSMIRVGKDSRIRTRFLRPVTQDLPSSSV